MNKENLQLSGRLEENKHFTSDLVPPFPKKNFLLEVTNFCNHRCVFCANSKMTRKRGVIEPEIADKVLREAYSLGTREVGFYATGEPLANKDLFEYIRKAKELGFEYTYLTTNGALLDEDVCEKLVTSGIDSIKFSINAGTRESYAKIHGRDDFDRVLRNVRYVSRYRRENKADFKLYISFIVTRITLSEQETLKRLLGEYVDEIVFLPVLNQHGLMFEVNENLTIGDSREGVKRPCSLLFNAFTVSWEGFLTACCADFQNYLVIADLHNTTLKEAWESPLYQELRRKHLTDSLEGTMCYNCIYNVKSEIKPLTEHYATLF